MINVLLVEDEISWWRILGSRIREVGGNAVAVQWAKTAEEAVQMAAAERPQIVLMDGSLGLGQPHGLEVAEQILAEADGNVVLAWISSSQVIEREQNTLDRITQSHGGPAVLLSKRLDEDEWNAGFQAALERVQVNPR